MTYLHHVEIIILSAIYQGNTLINLTKVFSPLNNVELDMHEFWKN
jgi:hypothetical protein